MQCKGKTISGERCARHVGASGFCSAHDPALDELRAKAKKQLALQRKHYEQIVEIIHTISNSKGWGAYQSNRDEATWRYGTFEVTKMMGRGAVKHEISGELNITVEDGVKMTLGKTS